MTAVTATHPTWRLSAQGVLRSEWIKLTTLRSTWWSIAIVAVLSIGITALLAAALASFSDGSAGTINGVLAVLNPTTFTMLLAGALGAITVTGEYSTGMIRSTLAAEPRRGAVLAGKAVAVGGFLLLSSIVVFAVAALVATPLLGDTAPIPWDDPAGSIVPLAWGAVSMSVYALLGLSFGFVLRNGPGAIAATVGLLFVLPIIPNFFPSSGSWAWVQDLAQYLPANAGQALMIPGSDGSLADGPAALTLLIWVVAGLAGSWAVLRGRDA